MKPEQSIIAGERVSYFDLDRRFVARDEYNHNELIAAQIRGKLVGWEKVLQHRCTLVVAPANFGKTTEMQFQAQRLREQDQAAVFVALRRLADRRTLEKALTEEEREAFREWGRGPARPITVFVDSLDEAAAGKLESIGDLLGDLAEELEWPNEHVRWVVSTRPAMLTAVVIQQLTTLLTKSPAKKKLGAARARRTTLTISEPAKIEKLQLFSMAPLEDHQSVAYLSGRYPSLDAKRLVSLANERGLAGFTSSPGGLDVLSRIDIISKPPTSLTEVFERVLSAIEARLGEDPRLADAGRPAPGALAAAAQRLAAASQVCQRLNIEMSESSLKVPADALSARLITSSLLDEAGTRLLLGSQLFIDAGFHQVKMYPDELLPYLAAKRLAGLVDSPEQAERLLDSFSWVAPSGEQGVHKAHLPMMGWLATLNPQCREAILQREPQALAFFGDLRNPGVPLFAAQEALTKSIERLVKQGDQPGRGMFTMTSENFWQAGPERVAPTIAELYNEYHDDYWARDVLTDIASVCKLDVLRPKILSRHGSNFGRLLSDRTDVEYLISVGRAADIKSLASAALTSTKISEGVTSLLLRKLGWNQFSARQVATLVDNQFAAGPRGFNLGYSLESGGLLASATDVQLHQLARALVLRLARLRKTEPAPWRSRDASEYADIVARVLEILISRTDGISPRIGQLYFVFRRLVRTKHLHSSEIDDLASTVSANANLRAALLRSITRRNLSDDDMTLHVVGHLRLADYSAEDIKAVNHSQLNHVFAAWIAMCGTATAPAPPKKRRKQENTLTVDATSKRRLAGVLPTNRIARRRGRLRRTPGRQRDPHDFVDAVQGMHRRTRQTKVGCLEVPSLRIPGPERLHAFERQLMRFLKALRSAVATEPIDPLHVLLGRVLADATVTSPRTVDVCGCGWTSRLWRPD